MQNVLNKTHARHQELTQAHQREMLRVAADTPWWSAGLSVRTSLQDLADTFSRYAAHKPLYTWPGKTMRPQLNCAYMLCNSS